MTDAIGSTVATTDQAASITQRYDYAAYGALPNAPTSGNAFQYAGREADDSGLTYMRARYYSPGLGRFVSEDPIREDGGFNGYAYVGGDPVAYNDPLSLAPGNSGERGWSGGAGGTNNLGKHRKDDPTNSGWGWQKNPQTGKKTYKKRPPYVGPPTDEGQSQKMDPFEHALQQDYPPSYAPSPATKAITVGGILLIVVIVLLAPVGA